MQLEETTQAVTKSACDFFYFFSRFEFALKANGYLKSRRPGNRAEPDWNMFEKKWQSKYKLTQSAAHMLDLAPKCQVVGANGELSWLPLNLGNFKFELNKVILSLRTVRNNLFHGGKHGVEDWDNGTRACDLLNAGVTILNELSSMASLDADYKRLY